MLLITIWKNNYYLYACKYWTTSMGCFSLHEHILYISQVYFYKVKLPLKLQVMAEVCFIWEKQMTFGGFPGYIFRKCCKVIASVPKEVVSTRILSAATSSSSAGWEPPSSTSVFLLSTR